MTAPNFSPRPEPWPDILAGYADGELSPKAHAAVARWLAAHPQDANAAQTQRELSPDNWRLWQEAEPPLPSAAAWDHVHNAITQALCSEPSVPAHRERGRWARTGLYVFTSLAAAAIGFVAVAAILLQSDPIPPAVAVRTAPDPVDPLAELAVLPVVDPAEVDIQRVNGLRGGGLPIGETPLPGSLVLAFGGDVELEDAEPHPAWPDGGPHIPTAPGDAAMIFAAAPR